MHRRWIIKSQSFILGSHGYTFWQWKHTDRHINRPTDWPESALPVVPTFFSLGNGLRNGSLTCPFLVPIAFHFWCTSSFSFFYSPAHANSFILLDSPFQGSHGNVSLFLTNPFITTLCDVNEPLPKWGRSIGVFLWYLCCPGTTNTVPMVQQPLFLWLCWLCWTFPLICSPFICNFSLRKFAGSCSHNNWPFPSAFFRLCCHSLPSSTLGP